jgi:hypothetical protein
MLLLNLQQSRMKIMKMMMKKLHMQRQQARRRQEEGRQEGVVRRRRAQLGLRRVLAKRSRPLEEVRPELVPPHPHLSPPLALARLARLLLLPLLVARARK